MRLITSLVCTTLICCLLGITAANEHTSYTSLVYCLLLMLYALENWTLLKDLEAKRTAEENERQDQRLIHRLVYQNMLLQKGAHESDSTRRRHAMSL